MTSRKHHSLASLTDEEQAAALAAVQALRAGSSTGKGWYSPDSEPGLFRLHCPSSKQAWVHRFHLNGKQRQQVRGEMSVEEVRLANHHVLHIGALDPTGVTIFRALDEDVTAFAEHYGDPITFERLALPPQQVRN